ncbi:MAG: glycerol-3-phosphate 1-O-acyltransferase PlsY [Oscillospiraceae bacterium]
MEYTLTVNICIAIGVIFSYLMGSVNFAIIITKIFAHKDIRDFGSGNAGLTNVMRVVGKGPALLTLIGDFSKGIISVVFVRILLLLVCSSKGVVLADYLCVYAALLGHIFPIFYGFKGGKGILVTFGTLVVLSPLAALICLAVFVIIVFISKYVSLGSIIAAICFPISIVLMRLAFSPHKIDLFEVGLTLPIVALIIFMHRQNIKRLVNHQENKLSFHKK